jgi:hypothetical protein
VGLFRRGGKDAATDEASDAVDAPVDESTAVEVDELDEVVEVDAEPFERTGGPWDADEVSDDITRVDLGAVRLPGVQGMELRMEIDKATDTVSAASILLDGSSLQVQAFAAPRTEGIWREVRVELAEGIRSAGGSARDVDGPFGRELHAKVPFDGPQGRGLQDARFVGVDGPRWFLRGVFSGTASRPGGQAVLENLFRGCVVVRGGAPLAPKGPIPLSLPGDIEDSPEVRPPLEPFARGPEITEIH